MREVISLHTGQAGVQLGMTLWELFCQEHGLSPMGELFKDCKDDFDGLGPFFQEKRDNRYCPRCCFFDLEPSVTDNLKYGPYRKLYNHNHIMYGMEDAANNYARGYFTLGQEKLPAAMEHVRIVAEACGHLQGFMLFNSSGGGTGSGFQSLITENLADEYPKRTLLDFSIYPSPKMATSVVEPYNVTLSTSNTLDKVTCEFLADNEAMYRICQEKLDIDRPRFRDLNRLLCQAISSITASQRFDGTISADFFDYQTNLVPYPRIHFPMIMYAPLVKDPMSSPDSLSVINLTKSCFDRSHSLVMSESKKSDRYMACCLLYRGDIAPKEVNRVISLLKQRQVIRFVDWSPTGIKVGINYQPPCSSSGGPAPHRALCVLANSTAIVSAWSRLNRKFKLMASKRAFFHWYTAEGLEYDDFDVAQENIQQLEYEYQSVYDETTHIDYEY